MKKSRAFIKRNLNYIFFSFICLSEFLTGDSWLSKRHWKLEEELERQPCSSEYFPGHGTRKPLESVVRLAKFYEKKTLPLLPNFEPNAHLRSEEEATSIEVVSTFRNSFLTIS